MITIRTWKKKKFGVDFKFIIININLMEFIFILMKLKKKTILLTFKNFK